MNSKITELLALIQENRTLKILPMVDAECVSGDDYSYYVASWGRAEVDEYHVNNERIYFKSRDYDELIDEYAGKYEGFYNSEDDIIDWATETVDKLEWTKAIVVHIDTL